VEGKEPHAPGNVPSDGRRRERDEEEGGGGGGGGRTLIQRETQNFKGGILKSKKTQQPKNGNRGTVTEKKRANEEERGVKVPRLCGSRGGRGDIKALLVRGDEEAARERESFSQKGSEKNAKGSRLTAHIVQTDHQTANSETRPLSTMR